MFSSFDGIGQVIANLWVGENGIDNNLEPLVQIWLKLYIVVNIS